LASQVSLNGYSLSNIEELRKQAENKALEEGITISVTFTSPKGFEHNYTINEEVSTKERYEEIEEKTIEKAKERLRDGYASSRGQQLDGSKWQSVWNEIQSTMDIEYPAELRDFLEKKEALPYLQVAEKLTEEVYSRVDRGRSISIQQRLNQSTEELGDLNEAQRRFPEQQTLEDFNIEPGNTQYYSNMKKVNTNLDFEENIENGDVLKEGRVRTTGDLLWYNREGESRYYLITSVGVTMQTQQGGQVLRTFDDKTEAWNYYQENRLG